MGQDPGDHGGIGDHGDDPHPPLALGAAERVDFKDPAQQLRPAAPRRAAGPVDGIDDGHGPLGPGGFRFLRQPVMLGDRDDRHTVIKGGVIEGDEVVTRGAVELASATSKAAAGGGRCAIAG